MSVDTLQIIILLVGILGNTLQYNPTRIINGLEVKPGQFPFHVAVQVLDENWCGGTLLNTLWALTAAHCTTEPVNLYTLLAGTVHLNESGTTRQVEAIVNHSEPEIHDISLLKVTKSFEFSQYIQAVKLPYIRQDTPPGTKVRVVGWGENENGIPQDYLKYVDILVASDEVCGDQFNMTIYDGILCAGVLEGGKGSCSGDSGGALVEGDVLIGVVSWGSIECATLPNPLGVYTQVSYYVTWIIETIYL